MWIERLCKIGLHRRRKIFSQEYQGNPGFDIWECQICKKKHKIEFPYKGKF